MKVLIVEDDDYSQELLTLRLEMLGCVVLPARDATTAMALAVAEKPDLALVDLKLDSDTEAGAKLIALMVAHPTTAGIPVVIHSILATRETDLPEDTPKAHALLPKPFRVKQLADLVAAIREAKAKVANGDLPPI